MKVRLAVVVILGQGVAQTVAVVVLTLGQEVPITVAAVILGQDVHQIVVAITVVATVNTTLIMRDNTGFIIILEVAVHLIIVVLLIKRVRTALLTRRLKNKGSSINCFPLIL